MGNEEQDLFRVFGYDFEKRNRPFLAENADGYYRLFAAERAQVAFQSPRALLVVGGIENEGRAVCERYLLPPRRPRYVEQRPPRRIFVYEGKYFGGFPPVGALAQNARAKERDRRIAALEFSEKGRFGKGISSGK